MMLMRAYDATKDDGIFYAESHPNLMCIEIRCPSRDPVSVYLDEQDVRDLARLCEIHLAKMGTLGASQ